MDPIVGLITTYNELNSSQIDQLDSEPSPLEFMRYVARNTPFVIRGGASDWKATPRWGDPSYLRSALEGHTVNVAVTPFGNADAPTCHDSEQAEDLGAAIGEVESDERRKPSLLFAKPFEEDQDFGEFLEYIIQQEKEKDSTGEVRYAQTQNDNLRHEYLTLFKEIQRDIAFARIALSGKEPEAINLWIGNSRSVTALHRDNYENIYVQVAGRKHFVLLPPLCQPCVNEQDLMPATYEWARQRSPSAQVGRRREQEREIEEDEVERAVGTRGGPHLILRPDEGDSVAPVPFATWDPDQGPSSPRATKYSHLAVPLRVTLDPGDMLYLPAMWYHKVSQSCSEEGLCMAVNYWYDMDFSGPLYPLVSFVRDVHLSATTTKP